MIVETTNAFLAEAAANSWVEWTAVLSGVLYVFLASRESVWCWPAAILSSGLFIWSFFAGGFFSEAILNIYYVLAAVLGWIMWYRKKPSEDKRPIRVAGWKVHLLLLLGCTVASLLWGWWVSGIDGVTYPYADAFTSWFAVGATVLLTLKYLENWLYFIVIDLAGATLFFMKDYHLTSALMVLWAIVAIYGYIRWRKNYREALLHA